MNRQTIFSKTAKGLSEASGATSKLPRGLRAILKEIDGKSQLPVLQGKLNRISEVELVSALSKLIEAGYVRETNPASEPIPAPVKPMPVPPNNTADSGFGDLDFTSFLSAPPTSPPPVTIKAVDEDANRKAQATAQQAAEAKLRAETEIKAKIEAEIRARQLVEAKAKQEAEEKIRRENEERARLQAEEKAKADALERSSQDAATEAAEKLERDAAERLKKAEEENAKRLRDEKARLEAQLGPNLSAQAKEKKASELKALADAQDRARELQEVGARARREMEEKSRRAAEEKAKKRAEEKLKREAEQRATIEPDSKAKREAEEKARVEAEAKAKREAEEKARLEAEAEARRKAEEKAKQEAAERARLDAEAKAKREAEEKARLEAEAKAKREAEEKASRDATTDASLDIGDQLAREIEELARLEALEKTRRLAEAAADAKSAARRDAQIAEQREADEKLRQEAEGLARREVEEKARQQAEDKQIEEVAEHARREVQEKEKAQVAATAARVSESFTLKSPPKQVFDEAEEKRRLEAEATITKNVEDEIRREARERSMREAEERSARKAEKKAFKSQAFGSRQPRVKWGKLFLLAILPLMVLSVALLHVVSFNDRIPAFEQAAAVQFQQPVKIDSLHLSLFPPHWRLDGVTVGKDGEIKALRVNAAVELSALFADDKTFKDIEVEAPVLKARAIGWLLFAKPQAQVLRMPAIRASNATLDSADISLPPFDARAEIGGDGTWQKIVLEFSNKEVYAELRPGKDNVQFEINATNFLPPFGGNFRFDDFNSKGTVDAAGMAFSTMTGRSLGGEFSGNAKLRWDGEWRLEGVMEAKQVDAKQLATGVFGKGLVDVKSTYGMKSRDAKSLLRTPRWSGSFVIGQGELLGVDIMHQLSGSPDSGKTGFHELAGSFAYDGEHAQLRQLRLDAGILSANGSAEVADKGGVRGRFATSYKFDNQRSNGNLSLTGTLQQPQYAR